MKAKAAVAFFCLMALFASPTLATNSISSFSATSTSKKISYAGMVSLDSGYFITDVTVEIFQEGCQVITKSATFCGTNFGGSVFVNSGTYTVVATVPVQDGCCNTITLGYKTSVIVC